MRTLINKIKVFLNRYNPIEITRLLKCIEKEIYNINKIIGSVRNVDIKLIQKDVQLLMNVINKDDDEIDNKYKDDLKLLSDKLNDLSNLHNNLARDWNEERFRANKHGINKDDDEKIIVISKEDDEIKALEKSYALDTLVHEIIDNILEVAHTNEDFNDVKEIIKKHIEHVINKDDELIKKAREEELFNELEEESRIIRRVLKSRENERSK